MFKKGETFEMAIASKTRNMLEDFVRERSLKWLCKTRYSLDEDIEEMGRSPSAGRNWIAELSPVGNVMVRRCSKILGISMSQLQESFDGEASDAIKHSSQYARNFLEYCCFRALALSQEVTGYLDDKKFRRLTFNMMIAWEFPSASSQPLLNIDEDATVGVEAFSRIAPAVPIIANVIISDNLFEVLTMSTGGRLQFSFYDKYLIGLESDDLAKEVLAASEVAGEKFWRLPLEESYWDSMNLELTNMVNTGGRQGGSITAALFLKQQEIYMFNLDFFEENDDEVDLT